MSDGPIARGGAPRCIAVDAMGGDRGPEEVVRGVISAAKDSASRFIIVGDHDTVSRELGRSRVRPANIEVEAAAEVIGMDESPAQAFRRKPKASIVVGARLVKEKRADALVTIGNTGAAMAISLLTLGRIKGIDRPAIAVPLPTLTGTVVLLDAGATVDCDPNNLFEFALMGAIYAEDALDVKDPKVGLLSNGEESAKGNELVKRTHALFTGIPAGELPFTFKGNVEGKDLFRGGYDVVTCDGFVGNVVLKTGEGVAELVTRLLREELTRRIWMLPLVKPLAPAFRRLRRRIDYAEYGGAPLLGLNGLVIIGHGRSDARAILNACRAAERAIDNCVVEHIRRRISSAPSPPPV